VKYHPRRKYVRKDGNWIIERYFQPISIKSSNSAASRNLTIEDQIPIAEDSNIIVNMLTSSWGEDGKPHATDSSDPARSASCKLENIPVNATGSVGDTNELLPRDVDTGVVTWVFKEVVKDRVTHIVLRWEMTYPSKRTVNNHFGKGI